MMERYWLMEEDEVEELEKDVTADESEETEEKKDKAEGEEEIM